MPHGYGLFSVILKSSCLLNGDCGLAEMLYTNKLQYFVTTLAANRLWSVEEFRSSRVFLKA